MRLLRRFLSRILLQKAWPQTSGTIHGLPLEGRAEVLRDEWGIPHITAGSVHDLYAATGFVHAQDRLWQMESMRRLTDGRLAEIAGEKALGLDSFARLTGMRSMKEQALRAMPAEDLGILEAYASGVNAYLKTRGRDLPLEFGAIGYVPEPWSPMDSASFLPFFSWFLVSGAITERLLALAKGRSLHLREWNDMFPSHPMAELPADEFFDTMSGLKLGGLDPSLLAFHVGAPEYLPLAGKPGAGSNNWACARGSDGLPILANYPHLGSSLPAIWHFCHLHVPGLLNVAGACLAGLPGIVVGRNEHVAWGLTNVMLDAVDVLLLKVDPKSPTHYELNGRVEEMREETVILRLPKGRSLTRIRFQTALGPAITAVERGVEAVGVLRWYGTLPDGIVEDRSLKGVFSMMRAGCAAEALEACGDWKYVSQNVLAADDKGHIGWHVTGAVPVRTLYSGRLPGNGSAGADWTGFLPYDSLPHRLDPPEGWIATANYRPDGPSTGRPLSYSWCAPYRYQRIASSVSGMHRPGIEDFGRLQMDVHSGQADRILPKLLALPLKAGRAAEAARILGDWDHEVRADSAAAALYEVFLTQLDRELLEDALGDDMMLYANAKMYGIEDEIFDRPDSPFWGGSDGQSGKVEKALTRAMELCAARMGADPRKWKWGRLHRYVFRHPGATNPLTRLLLNPGVYPASGDSNTINASWSIPVLDSYDVTVIPSLRMIVSLGIPTA